MNATLEIVPSVLDRIRRTLVGLKMPRALEVLDQTVRQLERGESSALEVIDTLFAEELTLRENRRVKMALRMAKLSTIKTLAGFDFSFQPSLDRNRILALAQLDFIGRNEVIHFLGRRGCEGRPQRLLRKSRRYHQCSRQGRTGGPITRAHSLPGPDLASDRR